MDKDALLLEVQDILSSVPDFSDYSPTSPAHLRWLGRAGAAINEWNLVEMMPFRRAELMLVGKSTRDLHLGRILSLLHRAEAALSPSSAARPQQVFGPGAVYDFFRALREVIAGARTNLLIVDPYLDESVFDAYVQGVASGVTVRLLALRYAGSLKSAASLFSSQTGLSVNIRTSQLLHDRLVVVDAGACWVLGHSIKDAARKGPTYLAPLPEDAAALKVAAYEAIWHSATPV